MTELEFEPRQPGIRVHALLPVDLLRHGGGGGGDVRKLGAMPAIHKDNRGKVRQPLGLVGSQIQKCLNVVHKCCSFPFDQW